MAHTPGPWKIGKRKSVVVAERGEGGLVTGHGDPGSMEYYGGWLICESILHKADADLIAAAPDLLDFAKLVTRLDPDEGLSPAALWHLVDQAKRLVAKAGEGDGE